MTAGEGGVLSIHIFLSAKIVGGKLSASCLGRYTPVEQCLGIQVEWVPEPVWTTWRREKSRHFVNSNSEIWIVKPAVSWSTECVIWLSVKTTFSLEPGVTSVWIPAGTEVLCNSNLSPQTKASAHGVLNMPCILSPHFLYPFEDR
jgi:hypothetical protein